MMHLLRFWLLLCLFLASPSIAQEEDGDEEELPRGLAAVYVDSAGGEANRIDEELSFRWPSHTAPDARLRSGAFRATWRGRLMSELNGEYQLHAYFNGKLRVALAGDTILEATRTGAGWEAGKITALEFDYHKIHIEYESPTSGDGRLQLYWSGPGFGMEPMSQRLFHDRDAAPDDLFEQGEQLVRALRCAACHDVPSQPEVLSVAQLRPGLWRRSWLESWLKDGQHADARQRRMPDVGLNDAEVRAVAAMLAHGGESDERNTRASHTNASTTDDAGESVQEIGQRLFLSRGCLACHRYQDMGAEGPYAGSDLTSAGAKRHPDFFVRWLKAPQQFNSNHRMPVFELTESDRESIAVFLQNQGPPTTAWDPGKEKEVTPDEESELRAHGKQLFLDRGCAACHSLQDAARSPLAAPSLASDVNWSQGCLDAPRPGRRQPGYRLGEQQREAIVHYFARMVDPQSARTAWDGRQVMRENQCLSCHARGSQQGVARYLDYVLGQRPELSQVAPGLRPPSLQSVGDKLHEPALREAIAAKNPRRDWLEVKMPRFRLNDSQLELVVQHLVDRDRLPDHPAWAAAETPADSAVDAAGRRLVTADGFGCTSCHAVGRVKPVKNAPINTLGPNLAELGKRIRRSWYERWVRNPARMVPRMEMPSIKAPVNGVLNNRVDDQIAAVWTVLNDPTFRPPQPDPVRALRRSGVLADRQATILATDVLRMQEQQYIKPLLIALPNRHNFLFDLESASLRRWWLGDAAQQRTEGKTWYWEASGRDHLGGDAEPDVKVKLADGRLLAPVTLGQFPTEIDFVEHLPDGGVRWAYRLHFTANAGAAKAEAVLEASTIVLRVLETWRPMFAAKSADDTQGEGVAGAERSLQFAGLAPLAQAVVQLDGRRIPSSQDEAHNRWVLSDEDESWMEIEAPLAARFSADDQEIAVPVAVSWEEAAPLRLKYRMRHGRDIFPTAPAPDFVQPPQAVNVTPGFQSIRLAVSPGIMPTGLAWRPEGGLVVTSLKGRVWLLSDTDDDGLEDQVKALGDEFAAPYGAVAGPGYIDIVNKYALLRLYDRDNDGVIERWETLASGWGHTADYHDWTVGLLRNEAGDYLVATACQQDDRTLAAAALRGEVLRLAPRSPTEDDPRRYSVHTISGGHRFPMGIARNRQGELFVTDNQGNYNPFNELNQVLSGRRYGFLNKLERRPGFDPPLTPPAINIPHPWTRSVNGVCFLETPADVMRQSGPQFGPWEGDLIGCEYDSRRLIRMSLQRVGDVMQGAAYPFSYYHPIDGQVFLGPLVCAVSPDAQLYVGGIRDSGWGGSNNVGELVRMSPDIEAIPAGLRHVTAIAGGFALSFTRPIDLSLAADPDSYRIASYRRIATPEYGGPDRDRRRETIEGIQVAPDRLSVELTLPELRAGYVYEFRIRSLTTEGDFFPGEAFYTLNALVEEK